MAEDKKLLTANEAQQTAKNFLLGEHYESKIDFTSCELIEKDNTHIYLLQGKITMRSRSPMSRFVAPKSANEYRFKIEIDCQKNNVVNYEIV